MSEKDWGDAEWAADALAAMLRRVLLAIAAEYTRLAAEVR